MGLAIMNQRADWKWRNWKLGARWGGGALGLRAVMNPKREDS